MIFAEEVAAFVFIVYLIIGLIVAAWCGKNIWEKILIFIFSPLFVDVLLITWMVKKCWYKDFDPTDKNVRKAEMY